MTSISRLLGGAIVLAALLLSFTGLPIEWLDERLPRMKLYGDFISLAEAQRRTACLAEKSDAVMERLRLKERIVKQLIAGDLTLFQAAAWFDALHDTPEIRENVRRAYPAASEGESLCRQVISWAESEAWLSHSPRRAKEIREHLETELQEHLEYHGTVELPE